MGIYTRRPVFGIDDWVTVRLCGPMQSSHLLEGPRWGEIQCDDVRLRLSTAALEAAHPFEIRHVAHLGMPVLVGVDQQVGDIGWLAKVAGDLTTTGLQQSCLPCADEAKPKMRRGEMALHMRTVVR